MVARAAADEVNDLEAISIFQQSLGPALAGNNFAVEFHGDAIGLHAQDFHKRCQGERRRNVAELAFVSVEVKLHFCRASAPVLKALERFKELGSLSHDYFTGKVPSGGGRGSVGLRSEPVKYEIPRCV